tara:strand:+ start:158 stop:322 length:165 start_codon:yes stop_codon:yes gene_type:complete
MKISELIEELGLYPEDLEVKILADLGGLLELKIDGVVDSTEISDDGPAVVYITS